MQAHWSDRLCRWLGERVEAVEDVVHRGGCRFALFLRGRCDLKQSITAEIFRKSEQVLVLHHNFENVRQTFRFISVIEVDAGAMRL